MGKKILLILTIIFIILTFAGGYYVLSNEGQVNEMRDIQLFQVSSL